MNTTVVDFAWEVIEMDRKIHMLREEVERLQQFEKKYNELVLESLKHSQDITAGMLQLAFQIPSSRLGEEKR